MFGSIRFGLVSLTALCAFVGMAATASAGVIDDIPAGLADSLGITVLAAEFLLSSGVLLAVGLALAMLKGSNMALTVIVMLAFLGMLTAIGWLEAWLIVMVALVIALMFGAKLRDWGASTFSKE